MVFGSIKENHECVDGLLNMIEVVSSKIQENGTKEKISIKKRRVVI